MEGNSSRSSGDGGAYDLVLAPTYAAARNWNIAQVLKSETGLFGTVAVPFDSWVEKLWEQNGDGRVLVGPVERLVLAEAAIARHEFEDLARSPGLAKALASCARDGFGVPCFDEAVCAAGRGGKSLAGGAGASLTPAEREFLACVAEYAAMLEEKGLVEQGQALERIASLADGVFGERMRALYIGSAPLSAQQESFFKSVEDIELTHDVEISPGRLSRADADIVRFAFPTGRYAQPSVILQAIGDCLALSDDATVIVSSASPIDLYERIAPALTDAGTTCSVQAGKPFQETDFGKAFLAAWRVQGAEMPWDKDALTGLLHSSFVNLGKVQVWKRDSALRKDRIALKQHELERLTKEHEGGGRSRQQRALAELLGAASGPIGNDMAEFAEEQLKGLLGMGCSSAYVSEQRSAVQALADVSRSLLDMDVDDVSVALNVLSHVTVSTPMANYEQRAGRVPQVQIMTFDAAAKLPPSSAQALIVCDLTTASYPLGKRVTAAGAMLERLGAGDADTPLAKARREFSSLVCVPTDMLVLERAINDEQADPLYPSAMWEEFVDAYREGDLSDRSDIDNRFQLPEALQAGVYERGEEDLMGDVRPGYSEEQLALAGEGVWDRGESGTLVSHIGLVGSRAAKTGLPRLSASQIETYLECPYEWFITRRMAATELDEGFGPDKFGTFNHELFQRFYMAFGEKVTRANVQRARVLMFGPGGGGGLFAELVEEQARRAPGDRLVAIPGTTEEAAVGSLKRRVDQWLEFETTFLGRFTPVAFECAIDDVEYEGALIRGSIDRIDVNDSGEAVIVDYKGSIKDGHRAFKREGRKADSPGSFLDDGKVQAALYADVLARAGSIWTGMVPGEEGALMPKSGIGVPPESAAEVKTWQLSAVVGALYVSYNSGNKVSGAYSTSSISGAAEIPSLDKKTMCGLPAKGFEHTFDDYLDFNRQRAKGAIGAIMRGEVRPAPVSGAVCKYCPVHACELRSEDGSY